MVAALLTTPRPTKLLGATTTWGPFLKWDAEYLGGPAGNEPVDVTVVQHADSFEVRCN